MAEECKLWGVELEVDLDGDAKSTIILSETEEVCIKHQFNQALYHPEPPALVRTHCDLLRERRSAARSLRSSNSASRGRSTSSVGLDISLNLRAQTRTKVEHSKLAEAVQRHLARSQRLTSRLQALK